MNFSARRAFQSLCMGIFVIALLHVIVYQWKPPQKAGQFNFARKINEVLNQAILHNKTTAQDEAET